MTLDLVPNILKKGSKKAEGLPGKAELKNLTQFIRASPILSGVTAGAIGASVIGGSALLVQAIQKKRKSAKKRKITTRKKSRKKRNILNKWEIKHAGRGTKGVKLVKFKTSSGKTVSFRRKGTSKRRKGYQKRKRGKR